MKAIKLFFLLLLFSKGVFSETEMISVKEGDSVTLHIGLEIQDSETLTWSLREKENPVIVKIKNKTNVTINDDVLDGRFKDRLKPDSQTGDLTIRNIRSEHAGVYQLRGKYISVKEFNISVLADEVKPVSVMVGDSVTLNSDANDILKYDEIRWKFNHQNPIAEINRSARIISKYDGPDGRFKHRLQLDYLTGSLTIKNIGINLSGDYEVDLISSSKHSIHKSFNVTVSGETRTESLVEGDSVTLHTDLTDIQRDDFVLWLFGDIVLADIYKPDNSLTEYIDESYKNRLSLDEKSGSLTVRNIKITDSGLYELKISSSRQRVYKRIIVTVTGETRTVSVMEGDSLTLQTDLTEIHTDDLIQWTFKDSQIAQIYQSKHQFYTSDERFRGRLSVDEKSGSLTIRDVRNTDSGLYELKISSRHSVHKRFTVTAYESGWSSPAVSGLVVPLLLVAVAAAVAAVVAVMMFYRRKISMLKRHEMKTISAKEQSCVTIRTEIQRPDEILWLFGEEGILIARIVGKTVESTVYDGLDGRFRDRLRLDHQTGDLTIMNITTEHAGCYKLQIIKSNKVSFRLFFVYLSDNPEEVPLNSADAP